MLFVLANIIPCLLKALVSGAIMGTLLKLATRVTLPDLSGFGTADDFRGAVGGAGFLLPSDLPDLSPYALKAELPKPPDLSGLARKTDIPPVNGFLTSAALAPLALKTELPKMPDLSVYALKTDLRERDRLIAELRAKLAAEEKARAAQVSRLELLLFDHRGNGQVPRPPEPDDLKLIWGVGPVLEKRLNAQGIYWFRQIAAWTDQDIDRIEPELDTIPDRVRREGWVEHCRQLHKMKYGEDLPAIKLRAASA